MHSKPSHIKSVSGTNHNAKPNTFSIVGGRKSPKYGPRELSVWKKTRATKRKARKTMSVRRIIQILPRPSYLSPRLLPLLSVPPNPPRINPLHSTQLSHTQVPPILCLFLPFPSQLHPSNEMKEHPFHLLPLRTATVTQHCQHLHSVPLHTPIHRPSLNLLHLSRAPLRSILRGPP